MSTMRTEPLQVFEQSGPPHKIQRLFVLASRIGAIRECPVRGCVDLLIGSKWVRVYAKDAETAANNLESIRENLAYEWEIEDPEADGWGENDV